MKLSLLTEFNREAYDRHRRAEGFEEGAQQASIANAKNALKMGLSPEQAAQITSLPLEQVLALKEELTREKAREPSAQS